MLLVDSLKKQFDNNIIWNNLTSSFADGEISCIQGKSGEGKTTFLRCLNNLEKVDGGSIRIGDFVLCQEIDGVVSYASKEELKNLPRHIGMIFQDYNLFPNLTVLENLTLAPNFQNMDKKRISDMADKLLLDMELVDKSQLYPYQLSGGQQQRVAIARACMLEPDVLCYDEPTSALDDETKEGVGEIIKKLATTGMTQIIVTHDTSFAMSVADRILHIENGEFKESYKVQGEVLTTNPEKDA